MIGGAERGPGRDGGERCGACGRSHGEAIEEVALEDRGFAALGEFLRRKGWRRLALVSDANTDEVAGAELAVSLAAGGHAVERVVFPEREGLLADEAAVDKARHGLCRSSAEAAVVVGSGTLNDITRFASFLEGLPYCSVPTAASMDGYASGVAAMQFGGVKVSFPAQAPLAIFADPALVAAAPSSMALWGLGDLAGKASASFDWRLGHAVTGEPFCAAIEERVLAPLRSSTASVRQLLEGDQDAVLTLLSGLVESGVAMAMQGNSRPASGSEHHGSHFLDLQAFRGLRRHAPHGLQVAYATRFVTRLQRACIARLFEALTDPPGRGEAGERSWLDAGSEALETVKAAKLEEFAAYSPGWPPPTSRQEAVVSPLGRATALFEPVEAALELAGVPAAPGFVEVDEAMLRAMLRYANRLRNRFTVLDLLESQRRLDEEIDRALTG